MFFKKYNVLIFKDREPGFKNVRLRGWLGLVFFLLLLILLAGNIWLWTYFNKSRMLEYELAEHQKVVHDQNSQLLSLTSKVERLEDNLLRVQQFDAKLRVLMNIDAESVEVNSGGNETDDPTAGSILGNPALLERHRDLFARRLHSLTNELSNQVSMEEISQQTLLHVLLENKDALLATPSIWPVRGYLSSGFGTRRNPFTGQVSSHNGLDIATKTGTPIQAPARGKVIFSARDGAYGLCIIIDHGGGVTTRYAHMNSLAVEVGESVQRGDIIGAVGSTGRSTGPHLHYEVRSNGVYVDPMRYILD